MEAQCYNNGEFRLVVGAIAVLSIVLADDIAEPKPSRRVEIVRDVAVLNEEDRLWETLMVDRRYNSKVRPVYNISSAVNVSIDIAVNQIIQFDEPKMILRSEAWMRVYWRDELLTWNASEYDGLTSLHIPARDVWLPDLSLYSNVVLYQGGVFGNNAVFVHVTSGGDVTWRFPAVIENWCDVDMTQFPYDTQRCEHEFGSWAYDGRSVDFHYRFGEGDTQNFIHNGEWEMIGVSARRRVKVYKGSDAPFPTVIYTFTLKRRPTYYIVNMIMPCFVITVVNLFSFLLPVQSGEKISFNITTLLTLVVFLRLVAEQIPPQAEAVPIIVWYFGMCIIILCLSTVVQVFVYRIHFAGEEQKPFPVWARKIIHGPIGCLLRSNYDVDEESDIHVYKSDGRKDTKNSNAGDHSNPAFTDNTVVAPPHSTTQRVTKTFNGEHNGEMGYNRTTFVPQTEKWKELARCIDTFFFILFFLVTMGLSAYMLT